MPTAHDLLRARYPAKTHALLFEVRDAAGFGASRSCDAIAISTWPSRGLKLMGFEVKESRADWLREYRNPEKAETFQAMCDEWYLVVSEGDGKIVGMDELPDTWGLLVRRGNRLICERAAPQGKVTSIIDRSFLAAMLKRCHDQAVAPLKTEYDRGFLAGKAAADVRREQHDEAEELQRLKKVVYDFERASGISLLYERDGEKLGNAVRTVLNGGHTVLQQPITNMLHQARDLVQRLEHMSETVKQ